MWMAVKTLGSVSARSAVTSTSQSVTCSRPFLRIWTTSKAVQPPSPMSSISMGRIPKLRPPYSGAPSITTACPLPDSPTNIMPSTSLICAFIVLFLNLLKEFRSVHTRLLHGHGANPASRGFCPQGMRLAERAGINHETFLRHHTPPGDHGGPAHTRNRLPL